MKQTVQLHVNRNKGKQSLSTQRAAARYLNLFWVQSEECSVCSVKTGTFCGLTWSPGAGGEGGDEGWLPWRGPDGGGRLWSCGDDAPSPGCRQSRDQQLLAGTWPCCLSSIFPGRLVGTCSSKLRFG